MYFPRIKGKNQKDILQQLFDNRDFDTGLPIRSHSHGTTKDAKLIEENTRLRIWMMLRELDTMPVFIPHLGDELYRLLDKKSGRVLQEEVANAAKKAMNDVKEVTAIAKKAIAEVVTAEERIIEVPVTVTSCKKCQAAERKAKRIATEYKSQSGKTAKAVRRVMDKILSVWRKQ